MIIHKLSVFMLIGCVVAAIRSEQMDGYDNCLQTAFAIVFWPLVLFVMGWELFAAWRVKREWEDGE